MNLPDVFEIEISDEIIEEAAFLCSGLDQLNTPKNCAIALAIRKQYPEQEWSMGYTTLLFGPKSGEWVGEYVCDYSADFVEQFDNYLSKSAPRPSPSNFIFTLKGSKKL